MSFTDAHAPRRLVSRRAQAPFTPGYELVGVVEELGPGCSRLRVGDRIGALTVWGADAERVCVPESGAVEVPEDLDPGEVLSLVFTYMTAYQVLHRTAKVKSGETVSCTGRPAGSASRFSSWERWPGFACTGPASARDRAKVEALGAVAIDYRNEDFLARVRELTRRRRGRGVDGFGWRAVASLLPRAAPGGRLVVFGHYGTLARAQELAAVDQVVRGDRDRLALGPAVAPPAGVAYHVQKYRDKATSAPREWTERSGGGAPQPEWFGRTSACCSSCSARARSTRSC